MRASSCCSARKFGCAAIDGYASAIAVITRPTPCTRASAARARSDGIAACARRIATTCCVSLSCMRAAWTTATRFGIRSARRLSSTSTFAQPRRTRWRSETMELKPIHAQPARSTSGPSSIPEAATIVFGSRPAATIAATAKDPSPTNTHASALHTQKAMP